MVDKFSKYAIFITAPLTCPSEVAAGLFYKNVVKHFGLPSDIVSDRDVWFTVEFLDQNIESCDKHASMSNGMLSGVIGGNYWCFLLGTLKMEGKTSSTPDSYSIYTTSHPFENYIETLKVYAN
ncbi:uncharacterized protein LOC124898562 [Capsicum annuum]|uniref:uncharacterized protein LOC124898562 n=1 Tax=Capsicum annuum TaxID=4072 RepID=UPI001FB07459|nr:uncharacterized protein LOC124898562 [Capsicum annuum]